ncbi:MAG: nitrous oxide reductase family maturation protein NosD [Gemmatimonadota bacterium]|nr:nitrous oxide reductase family maturation protein NosD [Gemmatimonadota bacterium]
MILALLQVATLVVGTAKVPTIAEALRVASPGSRIVVPAGSYHERMLAVDKTVELVGEGWPVVDGDGRAGIFLVTAPGVTIRGFVVRNTGQSAVDDRAGIRLERADDCRILDNRLELTFFGVYLAETRGCLVSGNTIEGHATTEALSGNAIHLWNSRDVTITGNRLSGHRDGIYLEFARKSRIASNTSVDNLRYGLHFMFSDSADYRGNTFQRNGAGVAVMYSKHVVMADNRFEWNQGQAAFGLLLKDITDSRITGNRIADNTVGLYIEGGGRLEVQGNTIARNGWGLKLMANSADNTLTANQFAGNSFDVTTNGRRHSSIFEGNHWDQYQGYDLDRDGVGDIPFRPVRLFAYLVARHDATLVLQRSLFVDLLDAAERVLPVLSPETLVDRRPLMAVPR